MDIIADILLISGAIGAGVYCLVLGRRLNKFNDLEKGVGGAVAVLSAQVDDLNRTLAAAQNTAAGAAQTLTDLSKRGEEISRKLEFQMASLHDLPEVPNTSTPQRPVTPTTECPTTPMFARRLHSVNSEEVV
ncbi:hypothetical protein GGR95_001642 [Sulfitobacter undariae]|uniref:Uncharacterized protein n=1 Tax=Sulfitobacter undariae TaxID=1563671 RepID=A0A7W6E5S8_9RHOB|nr:hypothetical protein [Sulfitobacter undariae]MBB3994001.1 hypothetical protein [Sulfitobacter undariae]